MNRRRFSVLQVSLFLLAQGLVAEDRSSSDPTPGLAAAFGQPLNADRPYIIWGWNTALDPALFAGQVAEMRALLKATLAPLPHVFGEFKTTVNK